jgi:magnesium transporter
MFEIYKTINGKLKKVSKPVKGCWINIVEPNAMDLRRLKALVRGADEIIEYVHDADEVPKIEEFDDGLFILIRTPQKRLIEPEYFTIPLGIILSKKYLITFCTVKNDAVEELKKGKLNTGKRIQTVLKLLLVSSRLYLTYLKAINRLSHIIQHDLEKSMKNEELIKLLNLEKSLVYFTTSLRSNLLVISKLTKDKVFTRYEEDRELLEDVMYEYEQAIQMADIYSNILSGMMDAFASIISNNLNRVMKLLTSVTIILMIPTLIASIYGMNVELPFQHSEHAFLITMIVAAVLSIMGVVVFWRKELF